MLIAARREGLRDGWRADELSVAASALETDDETRAEVALATGRERLKDQPFPVDGRDTQASAREDVGDRCEGPGPDQAACAHGEPAGESGGADRPAPDGRDSSRQIRRGAAHALEDRMGRGVLQPATVIVVAEDEIELRDAPQLSRFELHVGDHLAATAIYRKDPGKMTFMSTDVMEGFEGQGIGGRLVTKAVAAARDQGREVVAVCPFMTDYLERHPELRG